MCGHYYVLRKWPLLGLDEIHSASTHDGQRECALEGARAVKSTLCPQGFWSIPPGCQGSAPFTTLHGKQHQLQVLRVSFYGGHGHSTLEGGCPTCPPHTHLILLGLILPTSPRTVGSRLRVRPVPLTFMSASSCIPSLGRWQPMARLQKVRRLGTSPFFARIGNSACRIDMQLLLVTHKLWHIILMNHSAVCYRPRNPTLLRGPLTPSADCMAILVS